MSISKYEQRAVAQGGRIVQRRDPETGKIVEVDCFNRDGWRLDDCRVGVFKCPKRCRLIRSQSGGPCHISREELAADRAQFDNR